MYRDDRRATYQRSKLGVVSSVYLKGTFRVSVTAIDLQGGRWGPTQIAIAHRLLAVAEKSVRCCLKNIDLACSAVGFTGFLKASGFGRRCRFRSSSVEFGILATASNDDRAGPQSNCDRSSSRSSVDVSLWSAKQRYASYRGCENCGVVDVGR